MVCASCAAPEEAPAGLQLVAALQQRATAGEENLSGYEIAAGDCMQACAEPQAVAFQAAGKAQYLFSNVDPQGQLDEIARFAGLYRQSADGAIDDARSCGNLRFCLRAKLPAV